jgi:hypothetical protein
MIEMQVSRMMTGPVWPLAWRRWCKSNTIGCPSLRDTAESRSRKTMRPANAQSGSYRPHELLG